MACHKRRGTVDLKGQDLVLYETAIQEALEQEKLYYRKKVGTIQSDGLL